MVPARPVPRSSTRSPTRNFNLHMAALLVAAASTSVGFTEHGSIAVFWTNLRFFGQNSATTLATVYVAIKYREVRKFLAGAFFVSSGTCWYLWMTGVSFPIVLPYAGTVSVETPEISGQRAIVHFILFLLCFYFGFISKPKQKLSN